ncbi:hypothetical protein [Acaryochloris marina]|uniref:hypothetical protein n=1 Tax=Acaryochloris marina TaxID=155978 RepID=UPI0021C3EF9E|nr:hypothetical protein [Acaryochloris marina]BDM82842.1 hypothetical protein AM10699_57030 [Acaryochloris marina MBIC10699]
MPNEGSEQQRLKVTKRYPQDSVHVRQYEALRKYYGPDFSHIFFQAAWSVLGPLGSALDGASFGEVKKLSTVGSHLKLALEAEALTLASGDESGNFAAGPALGGLTAQLDEGTPDIDTWEADSDNDDDDLPSAPIAGDPFG